jgi:hypothetical protein
MTVCAIEAAARDAAAARTGTTDTEPESAPRPGITVTADGTYAARLAGRGEALFVERWTLDGHEPYAVPLPLDQPEEPGTDVLPMADGRVLIRRRVAGRHTFSLLYPAGPGTGERLLGGVESAHLSLLPPSPDGVCVYALTPGDTSTGIWRVAGGAFGPEHVADVAGHCAGGVWLDRTGRMLALDRRPPGGGPVKTVSVDLERGGEVTPLLQITEDSHDRLLLADPDSGLLVIRSDAPGESRLGWGVLGSLLPVRFPKCLRLPDAVLTPFAAQPGQVLTPENCAVAVRIDGAGGSWLGVWRPSARRLHQLAAPAGWLAGSGVFTREGVLQLPYTTGPVPCGMARVAAPDALAPLPVTAPAQAERAGGEPCDGSDSPVPCKPVPLQQAPLTGPTTRG